MINMTKWMHQNSIIKRLMVSSSAFVALAICVVAIALWATLQNVIRDQVNQRLDTQIEALASTVKIDKDNKLALPLNLNNPPFDRPDSGWTWQIKYDHQNIASKSLRNPKIDFVSLSRDFRHLITEVPVSGETNFDEYKLYMRQAIRAVNDKPVIITATAPMTALSEPILKGFIWLIPCMLILGAILIIGTFWQIRYGLQPLKKMTHDIDAINRGELLYLPIQETTELFPLSSKMNELLSTNEDRLMATRLQFANLAHGLKTPIANLLLSLNDQNDPDGNLRTSTLKLDNRIKHHLSAARRVTAYGATSQSTNIVQCITDVYEVIKHLYQDRHISLKMDIPSKLSVSCDKSDLEEMIGNLMDNAFKWASSHVLVRGKLDKSNVQITFEDDGLGISPDHMQSVLLPGVREDEQTPGSGFGLTIVNELASLYGGSITLEANNPQGLRSVLKLPLGKAYLQPEKIQSK